MFLGYNMQYDDGPPLLFETMVFGGEWDDRKWRYATWEAAEKGHANVVEDAGHDGHRHSACRRQ